MVPDWDGLTKRMPNAVQTQTVKGFPGRPAGIISDCRGGGWVLGGKVDVSQSTIGDHHDITMISHKPHGEVTL